jgi:hypothetical protein
MRCLRQGRRERTDAIDASKMFNGENRGRLNALLLKLLYSFSNFPVTIKNIFDLIYPSVIQGAPAQAKDVYFTR